ncbi:protein of unknown function [Bradyrhizobium vignae]|uniref:Uncharacterized protein n=1 Tax=Bradyrhizobium vignae TaxID=1549949 RepID=A0A2U3QCL9_9BRAD|nr:protein of unknown function [Bradyrhizobium vignae]
MAVTFLFDPKKNSGCPVGDYVHIFSPDQRGWIPSVILHANVVIAAKVLIHDAMAPRKHQQHG